MTFIVTAATPRFTIQVADTRLSTTAGQSVTDDLVKTTIAHLHQGKIGLSFTGLAYIDNRRTDLWLADKLTTYKAWTHVYPDVIVFVKDALDDALPRNPLLGEHGLTVVAAGMATEMRGVRPAVALISNVAEHQPKRNAFGRVDPAGRPFEVRYFNPGDSFTNLVKIDGAAGLTFDANPIRRKLQTVLISADSEEDQMSAMRLMVTMLREHTRLAGLSQVIGDNCTGVIIQSDFRSVSSYFTRSGSVRRLPNIVRVDRTFRDIIVA